jgi:hypothetical protein
MLALRPRCPIPPLLRPELSLIIASVENKLVELSVTYQLLIYFKRICFCFMMSKLVVPAIDRNRVSAFIGNLPANVRFTCWDIYIVVFKCMDIGPLLAFINKDTILRNVLLDNR